MPRELTPLVGPDYPETPYKAKSPGIALHRLALDLAAFDRAYRRGALSLDAFENFLEKGRQWLAEILEAIETQQTIEGELNPEQRLRLLRQRLDRITRPNLRP